MFNKLTQYIKDVRVEMNKVKWPTRTQWINYTITVVAVTIAVALILGGFDLIFTGLLKLVI
jgi:preprotein translocase subunit SecE